VVSDDRPQKPLHVALLIDRWDPRRGGAERALAQFSEHLVACGHRVTAFGAEGTACAGAEFQRVRPRAPRMPGRVARERALARGLVAAASVAACDVTVGVRHLEQVDLYWPHGGSHRAGLEARRRSQGHFGATEPRGRHRAFVEFERTLLEGGGARRVVCVSEAVREEFEHAWPGCGDRLVVVPNGVDLERFRPDLRAAASASLRARIPAASQTALLVFAGREPELKGLPALLVALKGVRRPWHLVIAGPRRPARWARAAASLGLDATRVSVFDHLPAEELMCGADLCCLPTWRDPSPLVILEALAAGTPVLTTRNAGNCDAVGTPEAGVVLEGPEDLPALTAALTARLERIASGSVDRAAIRACVEDRGLGPWMASLERELRALAR